MRRSLRSIPRLRALALASVLFLSSATARAGLSHQACLRTATGFSTALCSASDVHIASLRLAGVPQPCTTGSVVTVDLEIRIVSSLTRYDPGLWIHQSGGSALTDDAPNCYRAALEPVGTSISCDHAADLPTYYDADGDACGDLYPVNEDPCGTKVVASCLTGGPDPLGGCVLTRQFARLEILCADQDLDTTVDTGVCASWDIMALNDCANILETAPETGSRCSCAVAVPVAGLTASLLSDGFESGTLGAWSGSVSAGVAAQR